LGFSDEKSVAGIFWRRRGCLRGEDRSVHRDPDPASTHNPSPNAAPDWDSAPNPDCRDRPVTHSFSDHDFDPDTDWHAITHSPDPSPNADPVWDSAPNPDCRDSPVTHSFSDHDFDPDTDPDWHAMQRHCLSDTNTDFDPKSHASTKPNRNSAFDPNFDFITDPESERGAKAVTNPVCDSDIDSDFDLASDLDSNPDSVFNPDFHRDTDTTSDTSRYDNPDPKQYD